ncbi:MAG: hypothetical protein RIS35_3765 [Pseudomonadota bacterium]|jgi:hypothetical protein
MQDCGRPDSFPSQCEDALTSVTLSFEIAAMLHICRSSLSQLEARLGVDLNRLHTLVEDCAATYCLANSVPLESLHLSRVAIVHQVDAMIHVDEQWKDLPNRH